MFSYLQKGLLGEVVIDLRSFLLMGQINLVLLEYSWNSGGLIMDPISGPQMSTEYVTKIKRKPPPSLSPQVCDAGTQTPTTP